MENQVEKKTNGWAIAGLLCSLFIGSITGLIFSIIGLKKVKECNSGKGLSIAGIIISVIRLLFLVLFIFLFFSVMKTDEFKDQFCDTLAKDKQYEQACSKNDDGSYNCIFATCTFKEDDKEDKKETEEIDSSDYKDLIVTKEELEKAIITSLDGSLEIDKKNIKVTILEGAARGQYKQELDAINYSIKYEIECIDGSTNCIKTSETSGYIPGIPYDNDYQVKFTNNKLSCQSEVSYNKKTKQMSWESGMPDQALNWFKKPVQL